MPTQSINLRFSTTDSEPQIAKFRRGAYGSENRITFNLQNSDGSKITSMNPTNDKIFVEFCDFRKATIVYTQLTLGNDNQSAYYDPPQSEFNLPIMLFVRCYRVYADGNQEPTEEILFEVV